jgi:Ca-activated chloride channel family protein
MPAMNEPRFSRDDPRLTAYALGELDDRERVEVEVLLSRDAEARSAVEDIRKMAKQLESALEAELMPLVTTHVVIDDPYARSNQRKQRRYPKNYFLIAGLAAAGFALLFTFRDVPVQPTPLVTEYHEVVLPSAELAEAEPQEPVEEPELPFETLPISASVVESPHLEYAAYLPTFERSIEGFLDQATEPLSPPVLPDLLPALRPPAHIAVNYGEWMRRAAETERFAERTRRPSTPNGSSSWLNSSLNSGSLVVSNSEPIVLDPFKVIARPFWGTVNASFGRGYGGFSKSHASYPHRRESDFVSARQQPVSTFSAEVDTASYPKVRRMIARGERPPTDAVRIEEMLNYFRFAYAGPRNEVPFAVTMEVAEAPWANGHQLVRIGLQGRTVGAAERTPANLAFLLDVSGSMEAPNKLPLVKQSLRRLLKHLRPDDRIALITYGGASGLALASTPVAEQRVIAEALEVLQPAVSIKGARGIELAYEVAKTNFVDGGINRVVLCTDGDFNLGILDQEELSRLVTANAKSGVHLDVLGFGYGKRKDSRLQQLANGGGGGYAYVDTTREAERFLLEQVSSAVSAIARDVKLQVEFNPSKVADYRLIGYERQLLSTEDFANDKVDAGEMGAGDSVTVLYEIVPVKPPLGQSTVREEEQELRYVDFAGVPGNRRVRTDLANELLTLRVRYKEPAEFLSRKLEYPLVDAQGSFENASGDFKFAAAVAGFGMILRDSSHRGSATLEDVVRWAKAGSTQDPGGQRAEFISVVEQAIPLF